MFAKKWIAAAGIVAFVAIAGAATVLYVDKKLDDTLATALVSVGSGSTGTKVSIGSTNINLLTGKGSIKRITVPSSAGGSAKNIFDVADISFKVAPLSLLYGIIKVETLNVGKFQIALEIKGKKTSLAVILAAATAYAKKKKTGFSDARLIIEKLKIGKGSLNASIKVPGRSFNKKFTFPPINMTAIGSKKGLSPASLAKTILKEVGSRAVKTAFK